jgi:DNA-directed RNA polymerase subunit M/transcription elongation factor TFIIS
MALQFCPNTDQVMTPSTVSGTLMYSSSSGMHYAASPESTLRYAVVSTDDSEGTLINPKLVKYLKQDVTNPVIIEQCPKCKTKRLTRHVIYGKTKKILYACMWEGCNEVWA